MKKSQVVGAAFVAMTIASPVFAADLLKAPAAVPIAPSWNGFYIGGEVGDKWVKDDWQTTCVQGGSAGLVLQSLCSNGTNLRVFPGSPDSTASHSFTTSGIRAGVYAGATFQINPSWVAGIEGDYAFYNQSSTVTGILGCSTAACRLPGFIGTDARDSTSVKNRDDFSLRLRAGFLVTPDVLVYGTGGLAFQRVEATLSCATGDPSSFVCNFRSMSQTNGKWLPGWTVGGGVEWKLAQVGLPNWLLRGEYRYSDFGTWNTSFFQGSNQTEIFSNVKVTSQIATAGLAYKLPY
jgi:outer membrane immunogenic protein